MKIDSYEIFNNELLDAYNTDDTYYFADDGEYKSFFLEIDRRNNRDTYNEIVDIINNYIQLKNI